MRQMSPYARIMLVALIGLVGCVKAGAIRADRDWYTLKAATNGRNMVLESLRLCQNDPSCSPAQRTELEEARESAENDYRKALAAVNHDHAHGWYANVNSLPAFARDPSLGLAP
jgi:hypothetical protein